MRCRSGGFLRTRCRIAVTMLAALAFACASASAAAEIPREVTWSLVTDAPAFPPRDCAGALVFDGRMWLLGG